MWWMLLVGLVAYLFLLSRRGTLLYGEGLISVFKDANTKISPFALLPAIPAVFTVYRLMVRFIVSITMLEDDNKILKDYEKVSERSEALVILSIILTLAMMLLLALWYVKRMDYVFYDGLVYEKPVNMLKFNLEVLVIVLVFSLLMWIIFCVVPMADTYNGFMFQCIWQWDIVIPVSAYALHRLLTVWLEKSFDMIK